MENDAERCMAMVVQRLFVRGVSLTIFAMMIAAFSGRASDAAEITCLGKFGNDIPAEKSTLALERWPSGRVPNAETCTHALIKGTIISGDGAKFAQLLGKNYPFLEYVLLWSPGGSVEEAMKIGRLIRKGLVKTRAPFHQEGIWPAGHGKLYDDGGRPQVCNNATDCNCASACFIIWVAGVERWGNLLGLHRPTTRSTSFASLPPDRATVLYRELLSDIAKYLSEMEVAPRFVEIMTDTSSRDIRWLTYDEAGSMENVPSIAEWIATSCGAMSRSERDTRASIAVKMLDKARYVSPQEKRLHDQLEKRMYEISYCGIDKIGKARDAIPEIGD